MINEKTTYDAKRYVELLAEVGNSVTMPFGYEIRPAAEMLIFDESIL